MDCFSQQQMTERASLYALGALSQWEARAFEEHLADGCERCAQELQSFEAVTDALALASSEAEPPERMRSQLLSLVKEEEAASHADASQEEAQLLMTLRADEGEWYRAGKGIMVKQLFTDPQNGVVTTLLKLEPGTQIPLHRHLGVEQCYVIEGDFHADSQRLGPGDFHVAHAGSVHKPVYTLEGALVLIIANKGYEVLEQH